MPAPLAKGIIITVSIIVAAGIAVYESPQLREWVDNSRRKIAVALHSLGDEINPKQRAAPTRQDSSMKEDTSAEAEERRRRARQEIMQRGKILEEKRRTSKSSSLAASFDSLVDREGKLRPTDGEEELSRGIATGMETDQDEGLTHRSRMVVPPLPRFETEFQAEYNRMIELESASQWGTSSSHPSESLIDFTPTSEVPDPDISVPHQPLTQSDYFSIPSSRSSSRSQTLDHEPEPDPATTQVSVHVPDPPEYYYAHPSATIVNASEPENDPFADHHDISSVPSIAGSAGHGGAEIESSDSLSEIGIATPASWTDVESDVGSHTGSQA